MTGCELIHCPEFKDGKCMEKQEYVSPTGEPCCSRREGATPLPTPDPRDALIEQMGKALRLANEDGYLLGLVTVDELYSALAAYERYKEGHNA